ncbi:uncharacterized protein LOC124970420 [Sciurus carolinensis]|uniref:uncharacterized protein LOC124970420 n=1 Tax=Sciurus carolinensis TaxID=30640 RepID=UPI001FB2422C|nr:uncharacterized protein LOC124970420 [Sciurus carolinensis]
MAARPRPRAEPPPLPPEGQALCFPPGPPVLRGAQPGPGWAAVVFSLPAGLALGPGDDLPLSLMTPADPALAAPPSGGHQWNHRPASGGGLTDPTWPTESGAGSSLSLRFLCEEIKGFWAALRPHSTDAEQLQGLRAQRLGLQGRVSTGLLKAWPGWREPGPEGESGASLSQAPRCLQGVEPSVVLWACAQAGAGAQSLLQDGEQPRGPWWSAHQTLHWAEATVSWVLRRLCRPLLRPYSCLARVQVRPTSPRLLHGRPCARASTAPPYSSEQPCHGDV